MFILSGPYNSAFLGKSLRNLNELVVKFDKSVTEPYSGSYPLNNFEDYFDIESASEQKILTSLEDCLPWLYQHFDEYDPHPSVEAAKRFKDKFDFRKTISPLYPYFQFEKITKPTFFNSSDYVNNKKVLKPVSGISSLGVHLLGTEEKTLMLNASESNPYILEDMIHGKEYAVDGYFDEYGAPVILNITEHLFADDKDSSDTLYYTNVKLVEQFLNITNLLNDISKLYGRLIDFPFHFEFRFNEKGRQWIPIELNPLRFSGYGTCEIAHYAYNINPYKAFFKDKKPKWREKLVDHMKYDKEAYYGFYVAKEVSSHDKLHSMFEEVLEYRIMPKEAREARVIVFFRETNKDKLVELAKTKGIV